MFPSSCLASSGSTSGSRLPVRSPWLLTSSSDSGSISVSSYATFCLLLLLLAFTLWPSWSGCPPHCRSLSLSSIDSPSISWYSLVIHFGFTAAELQVPLQQLLHLPASELSSTFFEATICNLFLFILAFLTLSLLPLTVSLGIFRFGLDSFWGVFFSISIVTFSSLLEDPPRPLDV